MSDLGTRLLAAFHVLTTDPVLAAAVAKSTDDDTRQDALLTTLGDTTTSLKASSDNMASALDALSTRLDSNGALDVDTKALLDTVKTEADASAASIASLNAAFPDATQPPAPVPPVANPADTPPAVSTGTTGTTAA